VAYNSKSDESDELSFDSASDPASAELYSDPSAELYSDPLTTSSDPSAELASTSSEPLASTSDPLTSVSDYSDPLSEFSELDSTVSSVLSWLLSSLLDSEPLYSEVVEVDDEVLLLD